MKDDEAHARYVNESQEIIILWEDLIEFSHVSCRYKYPASGKMLGVFWSDEAYLNEIIIIYNLKSLAFIVHMEPHQPR